MTIDVRDYWDFNDPALSEERFRALVLEDRWGPDEKLEIWAQIARTYSLRRQCDVCHEILDEQWESAMAAGGRPKASFELERGRGFRSAGNVQESIPFFEAAASSEAEDLMIDALHMLAIIAEPQESIRINQRALDLAKVSESMMARRWQGTLCNNLGWSYFDLGDYPQAIECFRAALDQRKEYQQVENIRVARWCLARAHRANGDLEIAMALQQENIEQGAQGYAYEEMGEILYELGRTEEAKPYFQQAADDLESELGADSERILRMRRLS